MLKCVYVFAATLVVKLYVGNTPFTRHNRLSNRWFDNRVERTATVPLTGCQTGLYNRFAKHGLTTGCIHDTTGCQTV